MRVGISSIENSKGKLERAELVKALQDFDYKVYIVGPDSQQAIDPRYKELDIDFLTIPITRSTINPFQELKNLWKTRNIFKDNCVNALIVYGIRTFPALVIAAKFASVKQVLCVVNGSGRLFQLRGIKGFLIKLISYPMLCLSLALANGVVFQNSDDLHLLKSKRLLWRKNFSVVNGSGVNLEEFHHSYLEKKPIFSMISRLTRAKGVDEYIQAAYIVKEKYPDATFYLVGPIDDDDISINKKAINEAMENGTVIVTGKVEDVKPYITQSRFFVLPSYYREGIPRAALEAMAMGRPIITTDSAGCRETVIDKYNGLLVKVRDVSDLAEKMLWMLENESEVEKMAKRSRTLCEEKFDVHKVNAFMLSTIFGGGI